MKKVLAAVAVVLPWRLKRLVLQTVFGYRLDPTSRIGLSWVFPQQLTMGPRSTIGHLTICRSLEALTMGADAHIAHMNWITGGRPPDADHLREAPDRSALVLGDEAAISKRHYLDCTNQISMGRFAIIGGLGTVVLTHGINFEECAQRSAPVSIGDYSLVGTNCVLLPGSALAAYCILGAGSVLVEGSTEPYRVYGGSPAVARKELSPSLKFFTRTSGRFF